MLNSEQQTFSSNRPWDTGSNWELASMKGLNWSTCDFSTWWFSGALLCRRPRKVLGLGSTDAIGSARWAIVCILELINWGNEQLTILYGTFAKHVSLCNFFSCLSKGHELLPFWVCISSRGMLCLTLLMCLGRWRDCVVSFFFCSLSFHPAYVSVSWKCRHFICSFVSCISLASPSCTHNGSCYPRYGFVCP